MNKNYLPILLILFLCSCASLSPQKIVLGDIDVTKIDNRPYIWATINDKRYQFLVDTGSTGFLLTEAMVKELGLEYSKSNMMKASGITGMIHLKTVNKISLRLDNGIVLNVSNVAVVNEDGFGLFPYEFLEALNATWDIKNSKLIFKNDIQGTAIEAIAH
jgi:predicted aspartyl protease